MGEVHPILTTMKTFAALLLVAAVVSATEFDALSTFQAADWSHESTEAPGFTQEATDAPTMTLMDAVEELKLKAPAALKEHVVRVAKHASLIQSTNLDARAKAYKHSFNKSKAALHSALNMLVSQLKAGHKHDTGVLKQTKRSLEKGMSSVMAAAKNKTQGAKNKVCPHQRAEEKARSKRSGAKKAMLKTGNAKVCPLSTTMEDMDVDKNTPAFGVELRNKWDRVRAKYVKHNAAHNAAVKAHEAAKSKVAAAYAAMKTAVKLEASNSHSRCKQAKAEYEVLKKDVFSNVKTRKSVATSVLVVKCYVNHITNNNAAHHCANRARRQSQAIWNIRAPAWKPCTSVASLQSQFGPVNWTASYRNCAGHRKEVKSKDRAKKEKAKKEKHYKGRHERAKKEKAKKAAKKEMAAKAKVREIKAKEAKAAKKEKADKKAKKEKAAKKEARRVKELKAKAAAAKERSNKAKAAEKKTKAVKAHKERTGKAWGGGPKPGYYKVETTGVHAGHSAAQPAGWGLSAWGAHGAVRNHASSWAAVHSGNHWPMVWKIQRSTRVNGAYFIKTTKSGPKSGHMKAGWGLSSWHAHGAVRNHASSRVAVHSGNYWLMDWKIQKSKRTKGAFTIKTWGGPKAGKQPKGWGLSAWQKHGGRRNHASSWVYVHSGNHWLMDWKLVRVHPNKKPAKKKAVLTCSTTRKNSNRAGVIRTSTPGGYTTLGGGMVNHYRH